MRLPSWFWMVSKPEVASWQPPALSPQKALGPV